MTGFYTGLKVNKHHLYIDTNRKIDKCIFLGWIQLPEELKIEWNTPLNKIHNNKII